MVERFVSSCEMIISKHLNQRFSQILPYHTKKSFEQLELKIVKPATHLTQMIIIAGGQAACPILFSFNAALLLQQHEGMNMQLSCAATLACG